MQGLYNAPTQVNNVCTIATLPIVIAMGAEKFAKIGAETAPGTAIFSISGNVERPGNYELELGTPMRELIYEHAGGIAGGRKLKAVIPGGSSVPALTPDQIDVPLDYDSLAELKTFFGAASLIVVDDRCCWCSSRCARPSSTCTSRAASARRAARGRAGWCRSWRRSSAGDGELSDLELLESIKGDLGKVLCALGEFAVYPVSSYITHWRDEFVAHIQQGRCPTTGSRRSRGSSHRPSSTTAPHTSRSRWR